MEIERSSVSPTWKRSNTLNNENITDTSSKTELFNVTSSSLSTDDKISSLERTNTELDSSNGPKSTKSLDGNIQTTKLSSTDDGLTTRISSSQLSSTTGKITHSIREFIHTNTARTYSQTPENLISTEIKSSSKTSSTHSSASKWSSSAKGTSKTQLEDRSSTENMVSTINPKILKQNSQSRSTSYSKTKTTSNKELKMSSQKTPATQRIGGNQQTNAFYSMKSQTPMSGLYLGSTQEPAQTMGAGALVIVVLLPFLALFLIAVVTALKRKMKKSPSRRNNRYQSRKADSNLSRNQSQMVPLTKSDKNEA